MNKQDELPSEYYLERDFRRYWEENPHPGDCPVVAYFKQKYSWEDEWDYITCMVEFDDWQHKNVTFEWDFWEGQTDYELIGFKDANDIINDYIKRGGKWDKLKSKENK